MTAGSNNPPHVILNLTKEEAEFLVANCDSNISLGLQLLQADLSRSSLEKVVEQLENFKIIRNKLLFGDNPS